MDESPVRKYLLGWAKLLPFFPRQVLARRAQGGARIPRIGRDSSQQQTVVKILAMACSRHRHDRLANVVDCLILEDVEVF